MIDWQKCVLNIRTAGLSHREADKRIGRHLDYTSKIARCEIIEPKFSDGVKLIDLHREVCGVEKTMELKL